MALQMTRVKWLLACVIAVFLTQTAFAQADTNNIDRAAIAREAGDYRGAVAFLEAERRERPQDPLVLRLLGSAYANGGEYAKAILALQQAQIIAPSDQDIALMLARAFLWAGRQDEAAATAQAIAFADPANVELPQLLTAIQQATTVKADGSPQLVVSFTQSVSDVAIGDRNRSWHQTLLGLTVPVSDRATVSAAIDRESRAGAVDTRIDLRSDVGFGKAGGGYVSASVTPKADFREKWGMRAGGETSVGRMVSVTLDMRYADYGSTEIVAVEPGVGLHTPDGRLALAVKSINLWAEDDRHRSGWSVRAEVQAKKSVRLAAGGATYPDTEAGITRRTRTAFAGAIVELSDGLTLRAFYEYERRAQSYTRNGAVLALSVRF